MQMSKKLRALHLPKPEGYLVQAMLTDGIEVILGLRRDPQLGPLILLGAGGVQAELSSDSTVRLLPLRDGDARAMVDDLRIKILLDGYRGGPVYDVDALVKAIEALAHMAATMGERLEEAEINPLFVLQKGRGVCAADGLVVLDK